MYSWWVLGVQCGQSMTSTAGSTNKCQASCIKVDVGQTAHSCASLRGMQVWVFVQVVWRAKTTRTRTPRLVVCGLVAVRTVALRHCARVGGWCELFLPPQRWNHNHMLMIKASSLLSRSVSYPSKASMDFQVLATA
jgi:hypothetical protein